MVTPTYHVFAKFFGHETCPFKTPIFSLLSHVILCVGVKKNNFCLKNGQVSWPKDIPSRRQFHRTL